MLEEEEATSSTKDWDAFRKNLEKNIDFGFKVQSSRCCLRVVLSNQSGFGRIGMSLGSRRMRSTREE